MDISNRALAVLLLATMVVSLGGTIVSLNRLGSISVTGMAPTDIGTVNLTVEGAVSIITEDGASIDFGTCTPSSATTLTLNSENTSDTGTACVGGNIPTPIYVRNDGNVDANVTLNASDRGTAQGGNFLLGPDPDQSALAYRTVNEGGGGNSGGCNSGLVGPYTNFTGTPVLVCGNLTGGIATGNNSFATHFQIVFPRSAFQVTESVTITFHAVQIP